MVQSERVVGWVRVAIAYAIWTAILLVVWRVVVSLDSVRSIGYALEPLQSRIYIDGLRWLVCIDAGFYTLLLFTALGFGGRIKREITEASPRFRRMGRVAKLGGILGGIIIGYFAYADLIYPLLQYQDVTWAYNLALWVLSLGIAAAVLFELVSAVFLARHVERVPPSTVGGEAAEAKPPAPESMEAAPTSATERKCRNCGKDLLANASYCGQCGAEAPQTGVVS